MTRALPAVPVALFALLLLPASAFSGTNPDARIAIHLGTPASKAPCSDGLVSCSNITTSGGLYPPNVYFAYVLVVNGGSGGGISSASFGIDYDDTPSSGVDIFSWASCGDSQFPEPGWPAAGTGNRVTFDAALNCQTTEPGGPGSGVVANLGYFYVGAYTAGSLTITPDPLEGVSRVFDCNEAADIIAPVDSCYFYPFGVADFGGGSGFNPCSTTPSCPCQITGAPIVEPGSAGHVYTALETPGVLLQFHWSISGNGIISGPADQPSVTVDAGSAGAFTLDCIVLRFEQGALNCSKDVLVDAPVPIESSTWGGVKALYR